MNFPISEDEKPRTADFKPMGYARIFNQNYGANPDSRPEEGERVVRVDRSHPVLGNHPHPLPRRHSLAQRDQVIDHYDEDLKKDLATGGPKSVLIEAMAREVAAGACLALGCWCSPRPCHAQSIADAVMARAKILYSLHTAEPVTSGKSNAPRPG